MNFEKESFGNSNLMLTYLKTRETFFSHERIRVRFLNKMMYILTLAIYTEESIQSTHTKTLRKTKIIFFK